MVGYWAAFIPQEHRRIDYLIILPNPSELPDLKVFKINIFPPNL